MTYAPAHSQIIQSGKWTIATWDSGDGDYFSAEGHIGRAIGKPAFLLSFHSEKLRADYIARAIASGRVSKHDSV